MLVCHFGAALIALVAGTIALSTDLGGEWMMLPIGSPVEHKTCRAERAAANAYSIARTGVAPIPALFSSIQRRRLMSDHLLAGLRGVTLIAKRSSPSRFTRLSIQPKQSASRTK